MARNPFQNETEMKGYNGWTRGIVMAGGLVSLTVGCATTGTSTWERTGERDLRGSVVVSGVQARSLLAGPLHLLHLDYETRAVVELYSVARRDGSDADCAGPALMQVVLHGGQRTNPIDADVGSGEVVCLVVAPGRGRRTVPVSHSFERQHLSD